MPTSQKIVEPTKSDLIKWFKSARTGDQCHVVTQEGQAYTHLTKLTPTMVKWQVTGFTGQDIDLGRTIHFRALLETWNDFAVH